MEQPTKDPNFESALTMSDVSVNVEGQPCGPLRVVGFDHLSPLAFAPKKFRVPEGGSAVVLPIEGVKLHFNNYGLDGSITAQLPAGGYAVVPGGSWVFEGKGIIIHTMNYVGLAQMGGPIEARGRLRYIDGCSDSLLVCPALYGEPCLNHLHIPPGIDQSQHVHPSDRIGIIIRGRGECRTPVATHKLEPGMFWRIPTGGVHSFHTQGQSLEVFAWHPDSEFGPRHEDHPMLTRTIVDGLPASAPERESIRTKEITA
jgi:hypothetical protein